ncbi:hypothetical protein [Roseobacter sp. MH60115]|uniref:hypothetical protein n=1 Tax=Roseobacter sp. MH60115 TaxID=2785324 RepID=UPI0018A2CBC1|nr:hypothetical protein [Roseobacter sp. MH60115]
MALHIGSEEPVNKIIERLSTYLDRLAGQVFELENTVSRTVGEKTTSDTSTITDLQGLDFLRQSLEDLALMTLLMSRQEASRFSAADLQEVSAKLKLKATQSLLQGENHTHFGEKPDSTGDLDLF